MVQATLRALEWLTLLQRAEEGHFAPIGNMGFYRKGALKARFDQQPIEAYSMVSACLDAFRITHEQKWYEEARRAFEWFLGNNDLNLPLIDCTSGGCRDGLQPACVNQNQGAESTLSYLLALVEMHWVGQMLEQSAAAVNIAQNNNRERLKR